jgi:putative ABC transport system ATP-binding protein
LSQAAAALRAQRLTREVNGRPIVNDISFEVPHGELLAIVGKSGSGKSSLLRLLNRLDEPSSGTVFLDGVDYRTLSPRHLRRRVGMVMQRPFLFPGTVAENLRFGPKQAEETLDDGAMEDLLAQVELAGFATRTIDKLSGGEAQRVSIARTLANGPAVLLMDEPTSALDEALALQVENLIAGIVRERHLTCLFVTHNRAQARRIADRVILIDRGTVAADGMPEEVIGAS